jgi:hypothetical protein
MHSQARMPDSEMSARHARNAQAACQQLERFTTALDDLIAQLEAEMRQQPNTVRLSFATDITQNLP